MSDLTASPHTMPPPPTLSERLPTERPPPLGIDRSQIQRAIGIRRTQIARIESAWVAACEREAARNLPRWIRLDDRATWDKTTWNRYLAAAARTEPEFMPRMLRLYQDIDRLVHLLRLPSTLEAAACH